MKSCLDALSVNVMFKFFVYIVSLLIVVNVNVNEGLFFNYVSPLLLEVVSKKILSFSEYFVMSRDVKKKIISFL